MRVKTEKRKLKTIRLGRALKKELKVKEYGEATAERLDKYIPALAKLATTRAYRRALALGSRVLIAEAGQLKEVSPDGKERVVRQIESPVKMQKGQIIEIK